MCDDGDDNDDGEDDDDDDDEGDDSSDVVLAEGEETLSELEVR